MEELWRYLFVVLNDLGISPAEAVLAYCEHHGLKTVQRRDLVDRLRELGIEMCQDDLEVSDAEPLEE